MRDFTSEIEAVETRLAEARFYLRVPDLRVRRRELEAESSRQDLWEHPERARSVTAELSAVNEDLAVYGGLGNDLSDARVLNELAVEESDAAASAEVAEIVMALTARLDRLELRSLFIGEFDQRDAVCQIKSGEGGTDSQDWAEMLLRMYRRWSESRDFDLEVTAVSAGAEAGYSSVDFLVRGRYAYGWLRSEHGVHRLVRISPFNSEGKRQTSFTALAVAPFFEEENSDLILEDKDLRIDTYRSSGAGGQHVNVTDSAVRVTHLPTGIVTSCQNERSQHQNKELAIKMLKAKLSDLERKEREAEIAEIKGEQRNVGFGSQIRSYVMHPYQMVKDLRSGYSTGNIGNVLDGNLEPFMAAWLQWIRASDGDLPSAGPASQA